MLRQIYYFIIYANNDFTTHNRNKINNSLTKWYNIHIIYIYTIHIAISFSYLLRKWYVDDKTIRSKYNITIWDCEPVLYPTIKK